MPRILHVLDHGLPLHSGYAFRTRAILRAQAAAGYEVRGITGVRQGPASVDAEIVDGLAFHRTPGRRSGRAGWREWREIAALARTIDGLCETWRPDVLHAHSPALCGLAAARVARARGIPLVYEIRAFWEDAAVGNGTGRDGSLKYWLTRRLENWAVAQAQRVVTICDGLAGDLILRGVEADKLTVVPNGVDLAQFGAPPPPDAELARELGLEGGPVIGFLGSFYRYEGLDDLIAAMPAVASAHPKARLLLVGGGPEEARLRTLAQASPAAAAIRFVGRVPHDQVERYYALVDVACYPRKAKRLTELVTPLKPLEAMAQGKIVAASDIGGHRELIADGLTGTLFAPDDPRALSEALVKLLFRRSQWDFERIASRRFVAREHDWANLVKRYHRVYQGLLAPETNAALAA